MIFTETKLRGAFIIDMEEHRDNRGYFARMWCSKEFEEQGLNADMAQCNIAFNHQSDILRGMHFQRQPWAEVKLVRCTRGSVFDAIVDMREDSETYRQWVGVELTEDNHRMLYVPEGFAHGYLTLEDNSELFYQVSQFYTPGAEGGLRWDDPAIGIEWPGSGRYTISDKDKNWPLLES